jgi:hypothetical protein
MPIILANYLNTNIHIYEKTPNNKLKLLQSIPAKNKGSSIALILNNNHYTTFTNKQFTYERSLQEQSLQEEPNTSTQQPQENNINNISNNEEQPKETITNKQETTHLKTGKTITVVLDYFGEEVKRDINKKIQELQLNIKIVYRSVKLKQIIETTQNKQEIPKIEKDILNQKNVVYELKCNECKNTTAYIGETKRYLKERIKEHTSANRKGNNETEPAKHALKAHGFNNKDLWKISVLHKASNDMERKIQESIAIQRTKPVLNKKEGIIVINL